MAARGLEGFRQFLATRPQEKRQLGFGDILGGVAKGAAKGLQVSRQADAQGEQIKAANQQRLLKSAQAGVPARDVDDLIAGLAKSTKKSIKSEDAMQKIRSETETNMITELQNINQSKDLTEQEKKEQTMKLDNGFNEIMNITDPDAKLKPSDKLKQFLAVDKVKGVMAKEQAVADYKKIMLRFQGIEDARLGGKGGRVAKTPVVDPVVKFVNDEIKQVIGKSAQNKYMSTERITKLQNEMRALSMPTVKQNEVGTIIDYSVVMPTKIYSRPAFVDLAMSDVIDQTKFTTGAHANDRVEPDDPATISQMLAGLKKAVVDGDEEMAQKLRDVVQNYWTTTFTDPSKKAFFAEGKNDLKRNLKATFKGNIPSQIEMWSGIYGFQNDLTLGASEYKKVN